MSMTEEGRAEERTSCILIKKGMTEAEAKEAAKEILQCGACDRIGIAPDGGIFPPHGSVEGAFYEFGPEGAGRGGC